MNPYSRADTLNLILNSANETKYAPCLLPTQYVKLFVRLQL